MPRKDINYSNTVMYKIVSNNLNIRDCYVGSTTEFTKRKWNHKSDCTNNNSKKYNLKVYQFIRDNGNWENWSMVLLEMYPCVNHLESLQRERYWCENLNATLNSLVPSRTNKEYREQHIEESKQYREQHKKQSKQYRVNHIDHIADQQKQYKLEHKEQIKKQYSNIL
jgi:hypothetical protein